MQQPRGDRNSTDLRKPSARKTMRNCLSTVNWPLVCACQILSGVLGNGINACRRFSFFFFFFFIISPRSGSIMSVASKQNERKAAAIRKPARLRTGQIVAEQTSRPTFRGLQPTDALTSENHLKGVALDRLHRRLIDAAEQQSRRIRATPASLFIFFLRPDALATIPTCIKRHWPLLYLRATRRAKLFPAVPAMPFRCPGELLADVLLRVPVPF